MYKLEINPFRVWFSLGCTESERAQLQPVDVYVELEFYEAPKGCISDNLEDVVDYCSFIESARKLSSSQSFKLIEHLAYNLHKSFSIVVKDRAKIMVKIHKLNPPLDGLINGVSFIYKD